MKAWRLTRSGGSFEAADHLYPGPAGLTASQPILGLAVAAGAAGIAALTATLARA